jgi:hypothetical protein
MQQQQVAAPVAQQEFKSLKRKPATVEKHGRRFYVCDETATLISKRAGIPEMVKGATKLRGAFISYPACVAFLRRCLSVGEINEAAYSKKVDSIAQHLGVTVDDLNGAVPVYGALQTHTFGGPFSVAQYLASAKETIGVSDAKYRTVEQDAADSDDHETVKETKKKFVARDDSGADVGQVSSLLELFQPLTDDVTRGWTLTHFNGRWAVAGFVPSAKDITFIGGTAGSDQGASRRLLLVPRKEAEAAAAAPAPKEVEAIAPASSATHPSPAPPALRSKKESVKEPKVIDKQPSSTQEVDAAPAKRRRSQKAA